MVSSPRRTCRAPPRVGPEGRPGGSRGPPRPGTTRARRWRGRPRRAGPRQKASSIAATRLRAKVSARRSQVCCSLVEEGAGVVAELRLVAGREAVARPDGLRRPDLLVDDLRRHADREAAGLGRCLPSRREADGCGVVGEDLALDERVDALRLRHHVEAAALEQLRDDLVRELLVEARLAGAVLEQGHPDALDGGVGGDPLAHQRIPAAGRIEQQDSGAAANATPGPAALPQGSEAGARHVAQAVPTDVTSPPGSPAGRARPRASAPACRPRARPPAARPGRGAAPRPRAPPAAR